MYFYHWDMQDGDVVNPGLNVVVTVATVFQRGFYSCEHIYANIFCEILSPEITTTVRRLKP